MRKNQAAVDFDDDIGTKFGTIVFIDSSTKRATVELEDESTWENVEFYYHCEPDNTEDGHSAFSVSDEVLIAEAGTEKFIIGFKDLIPRPCFEKRFFVQVNRGTPTAPAHVYYWLLISPDGASIKVSEVFDAEPLLKMCLTPKENDHVATKSFMLEDERWVAGPHVLMKDRILRFNLMGYPETGVEYTDFSCYPEPSKCPGGMPRGHPCPPNRFYCDCESGVMVWYSCYTVVDPVYPYPLIHYCFGTVLKATASMILVPYESPSGTDYHKIIDPVTGEELIKTFKCASYEVDSEGFESLWYYEPVGLNCSPPDPDPMCGADAGIPYQMLIDVNLVDKEKLEIFLPWEERPIKFTIDLTGPGFATTEDDHTYEVAIETHHWYWSKEGFEQKKFCDLDYSDQLGGVVDYLTNIVVNHTHSGCDCPEVIACSAIEQTEKERVCCCIGCGQGTHVGKFEETYSAQWQRIYWRQSAGSNTHHRKTFYFLYLPGDTILSMRSWEHEVVIVQGKMGEGPHCHANWVFDHWEGSHACFRLLCEGPGTPGGPAQIRYIGETLKQKLVDSLNADWCSPNVVFVGAEKDRVYTDAFRELGNYSRSWFGGVQYGGVCYGLENNPAAFASSIWAPAQEYMGPGKCGFPSANSFISYEDPGVLWGSDVTLSSFSRNHSMVDYAYGDPFVSAFCGGASGWFWKRYGTQNTLDEPLVLEYEVDGEVVFSEKDAQGKLLVNRTFYLDDRATDKNHGIITAGAGIVPGAFNWNTMEYNPDIPYYWEIHWAQKDGPTQDITTKVTNALGCEVWQLCKLGLI